MTLKFYEAWRTVAPSSPKDQWQDDLQALVDDQFENAPNVFTIQRLNNSTGLYEDVVVRLSLPYKIEQASSRADDFRQIIFSNRNTKAVLGDAFKFNNFYWLCIDGSRFGYPTSSCIVQKCTNTLTLYKNNILHQIPIIIESGQLGTESNRYLESPSTTVVARLSNTEITRQIKRSEKYQIGMQNYTTVDVNDIIEPGLLVLKLEYSQESQLEYEFVINILNGSDIDIQENSTLQLNVNVLVNGNLISPTPELIFESDNEEVVEVNSSGLVTALDVIDNCVITVKLASDEGVQQSININVIEEVVDSYTYTLNSNSQPDTEIINGYSKTYIAQKYNNGYPIAQTFTFAVVGDSSAYQLTIIDGGSCSIKALKSGHTITLQAIDDSDNSKIVGKNIILKNLF